MPPHMGQAAVQPQFAQRHETVQRVLGNGAQRAHQRQGDGEIVVAAFLGQVGRRQVDGDALGRQTKPRGHQGSPDTLAGFLDGLVGQADQDELWKAGRDLHLHIDRHCLNALKRHCRYAGDHPQCPQARAELSKAGSAEQERKANGL